MMHQLPICRIRAFAEAGADLRLLPNCSVQRTPASTARPGSSDTFPFFRPPDELLFTRTESQKHIQSP